MSRSLTVRIRETSETEKFGIIEGESATFGVKYRISPTRTESLRDGAFDASLAEKGGVLPVFWSHGWKKTNETPIGHAMMRAEDGVMKTTAHLYIHTDPRARSVFEATDAGALTEWSVGFLTPNPDDVQLRGDNEEVVRGDMLEVSIVMKGAGLTAVTNTREDESDAEAEASAAALAAEEAEAAELAEWAEAVEAEELRERALTLLRHGAINAEHLS